MRWRNSSLACVVLVFFGAMTGAPSRADLVLTVTPSLAPNVFGSPSWSGYVTNAISALENGLSSNGPANDPTLYQAIANGATIGSNEIVATGFPSWLGSADPGTAFGSKFAGELGNRLHFGLAAIGDPHTQFSLSQLTYSLISNNDPSFDFTGSFLTTDTYSATRVGVVLNSDGTVNHYVTSGASTQLVNELFYVGVGNAYTAYSTDPGATNQDKLNNSNNAIPNQMVTTTYTIGGVTGSATVNVDSAPAPEPTTLASAATGVLMLMGYVWRMRRRARLATA